MREIESEFNRTFAHWNITLPPDDIENRKAGKIVQAGWAIWYLFGSDEKGEYLDYYASHRMTNDRHVRIYSNGETEHLPAFWPFRRCGNTRAEDERLEAEYLAENQRIAKLLEEKGFGLAGNEPFGILINRLLRKEILEE